MGRSWTSTGTFSSFPAPWRTRSINADAVPLGNRNFSRTITSLRSGTANTTPNKQTPRLQTTSFQNPSLRGPPSPSPPSPVGPSSPSFNRNSKAGITPTNPHPSGIVPTAPATVWIRTFSIGVNGKDSCLDNTLKTEKPIKAEGMAIVLIHPV